MNNLELFSNVFNKTKSKIYLKYKKDIKAKKSFIVVKMLLRNLFFKIVSIGLKNSNFMEMGKIAKKKI